MKPTHPIFELNSRRDSHRLRRTGNGLPQTNCHFRPNSPVDFGGHCSGTPRPSFRCISKDYFANEAPGHFANELAIFTLMAITAAVPVIEGIRGAAHVARSFGIL